jgi:hypothetical protein
MNQITYKVRAIKVRTVRVAMAHPHLTASGIDSESVSIIVDSNQSLTPTEAMQQTATVLDAD